MGSDILDGIDVSSFQEVTAHIVLFVFYFSDFFSPITASF